MTHLRYDNDMLRRYWLGTASEDEVMLLDELSLTEDACALALEAVENDMVDAYAGGQLPAAERAPFEQHYLASSRGRAKAEFAQSLQRLDAAQPLPVEKARGWRLFDGWRLPQWQMGLTAVAALLLVTCLWLAAANRRLQQQNEAQRAALALHAEELKNASADHQAELARVREQLAQLEKPATAPMPNVFAAQVFSFTLTAPVRGAAKIPRLNLPAGVATVAVRLELESNDYPRYRLRLRDPLTERVVWQSGNLAAPRNNTLTVRLPSRLLAPQRYAFEVSGRTARGAEERLGNYPFEVVKSS